MWVLWDYIFVGLPIDFFKGILKFNLEVLMGSIGSNMNVTLGYFRVTYRVLGGSLYRFYKTVEMFSGDLTAFDILGPQCCKRFMCNRVTV